MNTIEYNVQTDGFRGVLYTPHATVKKVIIVFMGGEGKFISAGLLAERMADKGYAALALYYCKGVDLPPALSMIPLDMVEKAINMLKQYNDTQFEKIATYGISLGSILALMAGVVFKDVSAVIAVSPTHILPEGFFTKKKLSGESFLTFHCVPYNYTPLDSSLSTFNQFKTAYENREILVTIPVEKIKGKILMIAGKKDTSWPATISLEEMQKILLTKGNCENLQTNIFSNGNHFIGVLPDMKKYRHLNILRFMSKDELVHPKLCAEARKESEQEVFDFLEKW